MFYWLSPQYILSSFLANFGSVTLLFPEAGGAVDVLGLVLAQLSAHWLGREGCGREGSLSSPPLLPVDLGLVSDLIDFSLDCEGSSVD